MTDVTPRPMATPDLAGLLSKPNRRRLSVLTDEPPEAPEPSEPDASGEAPVDTRPMSSPAVAAARKPSSGRTRTQRSRATDTSQSTEAPGRQYLRSMSIYLPRSLHQRLGERADADGSTRTALILMAVNRTHDSIGSALNPEPADTGTDLYDIPQRTARKEPSVETTIRVTDRQLAAIDNLAAEHGANRSHLISVALQTYLS